jgi:hypothetical protein
MRAPGLTRYSKTFTISSTPFIFSQYHPGPPGRDTCRIIFVPQQPSGVTSQPGSAGDQDIRSSAEKVKQAFEHPDDCGIQRLHRAFSRSSSSARHSRPPCYDSTCGIVRRGGRYVSHAMQHCVHLARDEPFVRVSLLARQLSAEKNRQRRVDEARARVGSDIIEPGVRKSFLGEICSAQSSRVLRCASDCSLVRLISHSLSYSALCASRWHLSQYATHGCKSCATRWATIEDRSIAILTNRTRTFA